MNLRARYLVPVEGEIIENAEVRVDRGVITAYGPARQVHESGIEDYQDAVILPGFVNAHTHLELTHLAGRVPPSSDFTVWLRRLVASFKADPLTEQRVSHSVEDGVRRSLAAGVTTLGDISREPQWSRPVLRLSPIRAVSYGEVIAIGSRRRLLAERLTRAAELSQATEGLFVGVSPHAPYTLEPDGLRLCAAASIEQGSPLCIHLAETRQEAEFTRTRTGSFEAYLRDLGVWDESIPVPGLDPVPLANSVGLLRPRTVIAHANYVDDKDIATIARSGASVAYCPRTHHAFGHEPHPFRKMLREGINVCVGTDSLATNPSLSVLEELRFLRQAVPDFPPIDLLRLGTIHGAKALGLQRYAGSIEVGKPADLVVIPLPGGSEDSWDAWLEDSESPRAVMVGGQRQDLTGFES